MPIARVARWRLKHSVPDRGWGNEVDGLGFDTVTFAGPRIRDRLADAALHRVAGVDQDVQEGRLDLGRIDAAIPEIVRRSPISMVTSSPSVRSARSLRSSCTRSY